LAKFDEQIKKKSLKQPGIDKKVYEEIQKHKENRPYVKRYLEKKPYFIVIFKKEILEKVPIEYL
jgi:type IV secretory pathway VirD2 relaxase